MDEIERIEKVEECRGNIMSLLKELVGVWDEIDVVPPNSDTDEGIKKRMEIGGKLLTLKQHLRNEVKILSQVESTPNLMDKWEEGESVTDESD